MNHPHAIPILEPDDFSDLDAVIEEAQSAREANAASKARHKRLAQLRNKSGDGELEYNDLLAEIRRIEDAIIWHSVASVALFNAQTCSLCGATHKFFVGWMTEQRHRRNSHTRRLFRGRPTEDLPERIEEVNYGEVELCSDCAECVLAINLATKGQPCKSDPKFLRTPSLTTRGTGGSPATVDCPSDTSIEVGSAQTFGSPL